MTCGTYAASTSGSGSIEVDALVAEGIRATISGSGDIRLTGLVAGDITASSSGSGEIILAGTARNLFRPRRFVEWKRLNVTDL